MQYEMVGLREDNTQGWLAAVGVIYILDRSGVDVQMYWCEKHPIILGYNEQEVIDILVEYLNQGSDILDNLPTGFRGEKAALDRTAGRVSFTGVIKQMLGSVERNNIEEGLNHPWVNKDNVTSLGWDPISVKLSANSGGDKAPDSSPHRGVLAGQWLAAESLPVTGAGPRRDYYSWVTWSVPLDMGGVRAVAQAQTTDWGGVRYSANVARNGQMGYFEPARTDITHKIQGGSR
ncbi:hypothetical protein [Desulfogranum mediterraneum]|uniref:hypothetical protein n=1 Tax=Desulfogranum mediterraneum TaxID=160661 RepID=UPI00048D1754|nr:hypothetical protein [Desulfogranum mediterraneum]